MLNVAAPVILGAVIGYVTNWIAIKMLFWPRNEKRIFGKRVPFTPGLFVRRREVFSASVSRLVESKFSNADDLFAMVKHAEDDGLLSEFTSAMGPVFKLAFHMYAKKVTPEDFKRDCRKIAAGLRRARIVSKTVKKKIDEMPVIDIEMMVLVVVRRELRAITWLGALLGAAIGCAQLLL